MEMLRPAFARKIKSKKRKADPVTAELVRNGLLAATGTRNVEQAFLSLVEGAA